MLTCHSIFPYGQYYRPRHLFEKVSYCHMFIRPHSQNLELPRKKYTWNHQTIWRKTIEPFVPSLWIALDCVIFRQGEAHEHFGEWAGSLQRPFNKELLLSKIFAWRSLIRCGKQRHGSNFQLFNFGSAASLSI